VSVSCPACSAAVSEAARFCRTCGCALAPAHGSATAQSQGALDAPGRVLLEQHEDSSTIFSLQSAPERSDLERSDLEQPDLEQPDLEPIAPAGSDAEVPTGEMSCEVCGASASGANGLCEQCARLVGSVEDAGD
jgi:hypothetical protein